MTLPILYERILEADFPEGYYYAHLPTLGLTTHGEGIEGARAAAVDLLSIWEREDTIIKKPEDYIYSTIEV